MLRAKVAWRQIGRVILAVRQHSHTYRCAYRIAFAAALCGFVTDLAAEDAFPQSTQFGLQYA